jgi:hypothetical protein
MGEIVKNIRDFQAINLILVTSSSYRSVREFARYYKLSNYSNITLARDSTSQLLSYFNAPGVPYLAFYNEHKKLKKVIIGKNDFNLIKSSLSD